MHTGLRRLFFQSSPRYVTNLLAGKQLLPAVRSMSSLSANPSQASAERLTISRDGQHFTEVKEGLAAILVPFAAAENGKPKAKPDDEQSVFYNPIQQFNRDLTVLAIKAYGEDVVARKRANMEKRAKKRKRPAEDEDIGRPHKQEKPSSSSITSENADAGAPLQAVQQEELKSEGRKIAHDTPAVGNGATALNESHGDRTIGREDQYENPRFTILDALSATGLRALRYAKELPFVTSVTANDLTESAVEAIQRNAEHNEIASKINAIQSDARAHLYSVVAEEITRERAHEARRFKKGPVPPSNKYDVIDLDPYGTAATFFDAAVHAVQDGGLLCVTCTDSGVFASHGYSEKTFALYGGVPVKGFYSHEAGLRLVIHALATAAARHGLMIEPLLSLSIDYYIRVFVKVKRSPAAVKFLAGKTMTVYNCDQGCGAYETQLLLRNKKAPNKSGKGTFYKYGLSQAPTVDQLCNHCGSKMHLAGPMYAGPLHSADFIQKILNELPNASKEVYGTIPRIEGMLQTAYEELVEPPPSEEAKTKDDELAALDPCPFFFHPTNLAGVIHCACPDDASVRGALRGLGYQVTRSHCKPGSIKTDAPWAVIWHVMREWIRQKAPVKTENIKEGSPAFRLLRLDKKEEPTGEGHPVEKLEVHFNQKLGHDPPKKGLVRYQMNPRENWGPLNRATGR